jgi:hypothetical protein
MIHQTVSGQTHQKWLDGWHMHHMRKVGNTYISAENLNGRDPLVYSCSYRELHNPNCSLNLYFTTVLIMKNLCIWGDSFKVILALDLTSDNNKEFKLFAFATLCCSILRNFGKVQISHSTRFYICVLLTQGFNYVYLRWTIFNFI